MSIKIHPGLRIGRLTVVEKIKSPYKARGEVWRCVCTCGNWTARKATALKTAIMRDINCGCFYCRNRDYHERKEFKSQVWRERQLMQHSFGKKISKTVEDIFFVIDGVAASLTLRKLEKEFGRLEDLTFSDDEIDPSFYDR
jgi:hypothetical protein